MTVKEKRKLSVAKEKLGELHYCRVLKSLLQIQRSVVGTNKRITKFREMGLNKGKIPLFA